MTLASPTLASEFRPLRFALRELRGGLHGFRIFVACIALGVTAIAGVGSFSRSLTDDRHHAERDAEDEHVEAAQAAAQFAHREAESVSYTHLTLPTNREV